MSDVRSMQHPRFARAYLRIAAQANKRGADSHRERLLEGLSGRVVEIGAGQGLNFVAYPATVSQVIAIEPDDTLRAHAERAAASAPVPVTVLAGHADQIPADDSSFDGAVLSLVLCSVPDQRRALLEVSRILRPGGQMRFYEHVRSDSTVFARLEDAITPLWSRLAGGCHPNRDTKTAIEESGFAIDAMERFGFSPQPLIPRSAHILGRAHKSA
jgi:ubiquinone/menaquinone biosynthesis C-methylase UbiE